MAVLVGIDEAGFGPLLGPLVISSSTFSLGHQLLSADLWQVLRKSVGNRRKGLAGRLLVADSKTAYTRASGIKHLQRTVLACLKCIGPELETLSELIEVLCPGCLERLREYPWYKDTDEDVVRCDAADKAIAAAVLADDLKAGGMELLELKSCCLDVAYYNRMVGNVRNKANVLFTATSQLIKNAFDSFGDDDLQILVDRQGGRVRYRKSLQRMFAGMELVILRESPQMSSYELAAAGRKMRLHFVVGADDKFLGVSLASMVSKYLRELMVGCMNRYFAGFHKELKPTAGYWKDGLRFIRDLREHIPHVEYDSNQLVRCR